MNYLPDSDQEQIIAAFQQVLQSKFPLSRLNPQSGTAPSDLALWPDLAELGWLAISSEEGIGGSGLTLAEEALLFIEAGRHLLSPHFLAGSLALTLLCNSDMDQVRLSIASGESIVCPLIGNDLNTYNGNTVSGSFYALDAERCAYGLVTGTEGSCLVAMSAGKVTEERGIDESIPLFRIDFDGVPPVTASNNSYVFYQAVVMAAAMATGVSERALALSVDYAKERQQFGKPIASFQAMKHYCAEMALRSEAALSLVVQAALELESSDKAATYDSLAAKWMACEAARKNAELAIQIHGAMGFTQEMPVHYLYKRAHILETLFADQQMLVEQLSEQASPSV
ncbi:acyl-CoA dehydrogenase family protein [Parahaliea mediterranea]|uniref:Acyl-CoA dehydrogenase family protein n=1 Tax=Parahaliea mediterranea TaxID=651086 RepID=A0A939DET0_9GAMM|nr:acyl-CoA dehydrogenase family protein [Parahaliea mediterranea]MBN7796913.1 acyl-CoA dehydrogenase family protein [Parahaliea mediterranea]